MRILFVSNFPGGASGYANQTRLFVPRIQELGHHVDIFANWGLEGCLLSLNDKTRVYPRGREIYGNDIIEAHATHCESDIVITLFDSWVFKPEIMSRLRWVPWLPVDSDPLPKAVKDVLKSAYQPIAYSKFGFEKLKDAGFDPRYVPHGVDCKNFKLGDKAAAREKMGLPQDVFLATMVAANKGAPSRKSFAEILQAWKVFIGKHPDAILYLHTCAGPEMLGENLPQIAGTLGITEKNLRFADQYWITLGFPDEWMPNVYQASDVLLNPSKGEGFGIPIVEAQACGCPVIVGNWTSMPELCFAGWKVEGQPIWNPQGSWMFTPHIDNIIDALEQAYDARDSKALRKAARDKAVEYDADGVALRYWKPVLDELAAEISVPDPLEKVKL